MSNPPPFARAYELGYFSARAGLPPRPAQCAPINEMIRNEFDGAAVARIIQAFMTGHESRTAEADPPAPAPSWRLSGADLWTAIFCACALFWVLAGAGFIWP